MDRDISVKEMKFLLNVLFSTAMYLGGKSSTEVPQAAREQAERLSKEYADSLKPEDD